MSEKPTTEEIVALIDRHLVERAELIRILDSPHDKTAQRQRNIYRAIRARVEAYDKLREALAALVDQASAGRLDAVGLAGAIRNARAALSTEAE